MRYDALSTPRVLHLLELISEFLLAFSLVHYLLYPPAEPINTGRPIGGKGPREYFLMLFPITLLSRPGFTRNLPFMLVCLSFVFAWPSVPLPNNTHFIALHIALAIQILFLHFPHPPSPLFFFPWHQSLPLSVLLTQSMVHIFIPVVLFFLPVLFLAALLLSFSLADATLRVLPPLTLDPSPMITRTSFLVLFTVVILLLLLCLVISAAKFPSLVEESAASHGHAWDRYSQSVGIDARRGFARALTRYSKPYYFPPPLNLLQLLGVRLPWVVLRLCGEIRVSPKLEAVEQTLWRLTVGPVVGVVAGIWLWNFRK